MSRVKGARKIDNQATWLVVVMEPSISGMEDSLDSNVELAYESGLVSLTPDYLRAAATGQVCATRLDSRDSTGAPPSCATFQQPCEL